MQRPRWLNGWGKGKNLLEACLLIDLPEIKVVEANFSKSLLFFAVGTSRRNEGVCTSEEGKCEGAKSGTCLDWKIFYDSTALPPLMPIEKARDLMAGIVSASAGDSSIYDLGATYIASGDRPSKGNAPLLLDYEMAKKVEEARKNRS